MNSLQVVFVGVLLVLVALEYLSHREALPFNVPHWAAMGLFTMGYVGVALSLEVSDVEQVGVLITGALCFFAGKLWPYDDESNEQC
ncbi:hypothetical protein AB7C87_14055 [Natrarchaeobius sp. A-rgal3]|uniref:hypothetical protein n=1 Tax=Natrarchaeobius versutus TaxID=1679078 RepID=UPI00350FBD85